MGLGLSVYEGNATLVTMSRVGAEDVEVVSRTGVNAMAIGLCRNTGFGGDTKVDVLVIKASAELCKAAIASVLDVIGSHRDGGGWGRRHRELGTRSG